MWQSHIVSYRTTVRLVANTTYTRRWNLLNYSSDVGKDFTVGGGEEAAFWKVHYSRCGQF